MKMAGIRLALFIAFLLLMFGLMALELQPLYYLNDYRISCGNEYQCGDKIIYGFILSCISSIALVLLTLRKKWLYALLIVLLIPPAYIVYQFATSVAI